MYDDIFTKNFLKAFSVFIEFNCSNQNKYLVVNIQLNSLNHVISESYLLFTTEILFENLIIADQS